MSLSIGTSTSALQFALGYVFAYLLPVLVFSTVIVKYVKPFVQNQTRMRRTAKLLSCDDGAHWLFGHTKQVPLYKYEGLLKILEMLKNHPACFGYWLGPFKLAFQVHHPDIAKTILSKSSPKGPGYTKIVSSRTGDGLIVSHGEKWKRHRRLLTPIFHSKILEQHCEVFNSNCQPCIDWCEEVATSKRAADITLILSETSYKNMMECMMSQLVDMGNGEHYNNLVREATQNTVRRWTNPLHHIDFIYKMTKEGRRFFNIVEMISNKVGEIIRERRSLLNSMESDSVRTTKVDDKTTGESFAFRKGKGQHVDFLDVLIQNKDQYGVGLSDKDVEDEVKTFFFAGQNTVTEALSWFMYEISKRPEFQQKCREEINDAIGSRPDINITDMNKLPYLTQCIKESLRLMPVIPMISRQLEEDITISHRFNGYKEIKLHKGQIVGVSIFAIHRHDKIWKNPLEFNPDRFSPENSVDRPSYAFIPFSAGPRNCIGQHFAMHQMRVIVAQILRRFEIYRDSETPEPEPQQGTSLNSANGIVVKLRQI